MARWDSLLQGDNFWASSEGQRLGTLLGDSGAQRPKRGLLLPPKKGSVPLSKYWKYQMPLPVPTRHGTVSSPLAGIHSSNYAVGKFSRFVLGAAEPWGLSSSYPQEVPSQLGDNDTRCEWGLDGE